jgi:hypothetical protein
MSTLIRIPAGHMRFRVSRTQTIRRGYTRPLPREMAGGNCPHRQRKGSGDIRLPRPDPPDPKPGNSSHMPPHAGANTVLPDPNLWRPIRRSLDPTTSETSPHNAGDTRPNVTARPGHTAKQNATKQSKRGDPNPEVGYPPLRFPPPTTRGTCGSRHSIPRGHDRHGIGLTRHARAPTSGQRIHLFSAAP